MRKIVHPLVLFLGYIDYTFKVAKSYNFKNPVNFILDIQGNNLFYLKSNLPTWSSAFKIIVFGFINLLNLILGLILLSL